MDGSLRAGATLTAPVAASERMDALDAVRGVAILGILLVNIDGLSGRSFVPSGTALPFSRWDGVADFLVSFLIEAKFYSLFSFLFGVGFAVFIERASARGTNAVRLFKRRLVGLLLIGLIHTLLIWYGDILVTYALIGFALIPFLRRDDRSVLRWATGMLAAPIVIYAVVAVAAVAFAGDAGGPATAGQRLTTPPIVTMAAEKLGTGDYVEVVQGNAVLTGANAFRRLGLMFFPRVLGMFLLGLYAGRLRIFADLDGHGLLVRRVFAWGIGIGLPLALFGALIEEQHSPRPLVMFLELAAKSVAAPVLSLGYAAGLCLLFQRARGLMRALAFAGRMALSNYLLHSVAGAIIFYGVGFGLWGRVSLTVGIAGAVLFFCLQMIASRLWLRRAAFGPAEWLWRMFTYRRRFALAAAGANR